jgi:putative PIN family toxin of toxin-antitoxin system
MYKIVIDANVWIKYARSKNINPLLNCIIAYRFLPVVNNYLLSEVFDALIENKWMQKKQADLLIAFIKKISFVYVEKATYRISPDPKDNYLFDLAIQTNCVFIISDDKILSSFSLQPIPIHSSNWLFKQFPV